MSEDPLILECGQFGGGVDSHGPSLTLTLGWNGIAIQEAEDFAASLGKSWHVHSHASKITSCPPVDPPGQSIHTYQHILCMGLESETKVGHWTNKSLDDAFGVPWDNSKN